MRGTHTHTHTHTQPSTYFIRRQQGQLVAGQFGLLPNRCHKSENVQNLRTYDGLNTTGDGDGGAKMVLMVVIMCARLYHLILSQIIAGFENGEDHIRVA